MNKSINRRLSPDQWVWMGGNWMVFWKSTSIKSSPSYAVFFPVTKGVFHGGTQQPWHSQECQEHCGLSKWITVQSGVLPQAAHLPPMLASCRWAKEWIRLRPFGGIVDRVMRPICCAGIVFDPSYIVINCKFISECSQAFLITYKKALNKTHWAVQSHFTDSIQLKLYWQHPWCDIDYCRR